MPTVESLIEAHVAAKMAEAYPAIGADQIVVKFPQGDMIYDRNRQRGCVGSETLTAAVVLAVDDPVDRRPFLRAFRRQNVTLDVGDAAFQAFQEVKRHAHSDYVESIHVKGYVFFVSYTYDVFE